MTEIERFDYIKNETRQYKYLLHLSLEELYELDFELYNLAAELAGKLVSFTDKLDNVIREKRETIG